MEGEEGTDEVVVGLVGVVGVKGILRAMLDVVR
jgi:hypothetical protein